MPDLEKFRRETPRLAGGQLPARDAASPMTSDEDTFWGAGRHAKFSSEPQARLVRTHARPGLGPCRTGPQEYGGGGLDGEEAKIMRQEMVGAWCRASPLDLVRHFHARGRRC